MKSLFKIIVTSCFLLSSIFFIPLTNAIEDRSEVHSNYTLKSDGVMPTVQNPTPSSSSSTNSFGSSNSSNQNNSAKSKSSRSNTTVTTKQKFSENSVQMIIGGQSEDGVAKQVALPIPE